jgi:hypothetical protein
MALRWLGNARACRGTPDSLGAAPEGRKVRIMDGAVYFCRIVSVIRLFFDRQKSFVYIFKTVFGARRRPRSHETVGNIETRTRKVGGTSPHDVSHFGHV